MMFYDYGLYNLHAKLRKKNLNKYAEQNGYPHHCSNNMTMQTRDNRSFWPRQQMILIATFATAPNSWI